MNSRKELDIGNSDFKNVIENNHYFVDKSLFIREVLKAEKAVLLLPRPRRFGKTLNLSMLRYFFDIKETESEKLFTTLKIWETEEEIKNKRGKYPVIYISFKDAKKETWQKTLQYIAAEISKLYKQHIFLLNENILHDFEIVKFQNILYEKADEVALENSLYQLTEYLHRFYKQRVVVLIDEYDTPIQAAYNKFYNEAISFVRSLLSTVLKDNSYLYKGVITGILRISKESIFSGLNNVSVYSIFDEKFADKFGFTESEVKQLLTDFEVTTDYAEIKKWYNGYKIGELTNVYNPWSILNFAVNFKNGFKTYWVNTSSDEILKEQLNKRDADYTRQQLLQLINNETIEKTINENFVYPDLDSDHELLWTLLTFSGYLTYVNKCSTDSYSLKIPNYEIKFVFTNIILKWLSVDLKLRRTLLEETTKYLITNQIEKFEIGFKEIIGDTFSYFDTNGTPEKIYQSYVLGLLAIIGDDYIIKSNRESGDGRYDIMLIPHNKTKYGVVIEIKQIQKKENETQTLLLQRIEKKITEAKTQIEKNNYFMELKDHKIENIIKLPIVFVGKEPYIIPKKSKK